MDLNDVIITDIIGVTSLYKLTNLFTANKQICKIISKAFIKKIPKKNKVAIATIFESLEIMKWLERNSKGYKFNSDTFAYFVETGNLKLAQHQYSKNLTYDINTFAISAEVGNLSFMKWLKQIGCPFGEFTFTHAVENGNLENMKWLKDNGCKFDPLTLITAYKIGNQENIKWLLTNNCI